jgi:glycine/D-amino acid oxidase-like deaminating enzyme
MRFSSALSAENVGFDKTVTPATIDQFTREILPDFPRLHGLNVIRAWAGLRPASPDSKPIFQLMAVRQGLCLANGHSRRGIC